LERCCTSTFWTWEAIFLTSAILEELETSFPYVETPDQARTKKVGHCRGGKAKQGDKTVLDALFPAAEEATKAVSEGKNLVACLEAALEAV
jgi:hypothetical protein